MTRALVVGGTGPTGPGVVWGLCDRGYQVTVLHRGTHEVDLPPSVRHLHGDPHFRETLAAVVAGEPMFDVVIASYGRLAVIADVMAGRTRRLIAVGGATASLAPGDDPRWPAPGRPAMTRVANEVLRTDDSLGGKAASAQHRLFMGHDRGDFSATYLAWPAVYGPRQSRPHDWAIVRRMLDGRPSFVIADGGLKLESRGFVANLVHAVLLVVDRPEASAGKKFIVADTDTFSMRQRIDFIADCLGHEWELVDAPYPVARPCHPLWRFRRDHQLRDTYEIRAELGYRDVVSVAEGLCRTVAYLLDNRPSPAVEDGIGETFAYPEEDRLVASIKRGATVSTDYPLGEATHGYDHPRGT